MNNFSNVQIAKQLKEVGAALTIKKANPFQIKAYQTAADSIEHSTSEVQDLWEQGSLDQVPGVGPSLQQHLGEFFKTGKVRHWESLKQGIPSGVFEMLGIPGVGPKTALKLSKMGVKDKRGLLQALKIGELVKKGLSEKLAQKIEQSLNQASVSTGRMLLPYALVQAERILGYVKRCPEVKKVDSLGSLRRKLSTIGDLDFSIAADNHQLVVKHLLKMPGVAKVVDQGESKVTLLLNSAIHLDFLIANSDSYGALLQHFTGSKNHNIHLRTLAEKKGFSVSEYGIRKVKGLMKCQTEDVLYGLLGMQTPAPEIREDTGEIEVALKHQLPNLVDLNDIKGDLHLHSSFPIEPSHDLGADTILDMAKMGQSLDYQYIGLSDHNPSLSRHTNRQYFDLLRRRADSIEQVNSSSRLIRVLNLLEVDITSGGELAIPDEAAKLLDFIIAGIHSSHWMDREKMTIRILKALAHPKVKILAHPTGRLLNERDSYDADWNEIFKFAAKNQIAMEINAYPNRLDLPDILARKAKGLGVKFVINTDSHAKEQMENMLFGVSVARRAWLEPDDIINTWDLKKMANWFRIKL